MKKLLIIIVILALIGGGAYWLWGGKKDDAAAAAGGPPGGPGAMVQEVSVITAEPQEVPITIELPGRISAYKVAEIRPQVSGIITRRLFEEGALVEKGQQLYQIDPAPYQAELARNEASLQQAQANIEALRAKQARYEQLLQIGGIARQEYDDAKAALAQGEAAVAVAQAAVQAARINVSYTQVLAPISGRIGKSDVTEGALVTANQETALAVINQLDPIYVDMTQSSSDTMALRKRFENREDAKIPVTLTMEGETEPYPATGKLQFSEVTVDENTGMVTLRALFPNEDHRLLPGLFVRAQVEQSRIANAILVPQAAVTRTQDGGAAVMLVGDDGKAQPRPVKTGEAIGENWLITSGLQGGEQVIVEGLMKVQPGAPVKAVPFGAAPLAAPPAEKKKTEAPKVDEVKDEDKAVTSVMPAEASKESEDKPADKPASQE